MSREYRIKKIDPLGRIALPMKFIRELRLDIKNAQIEIDVKGDKLYLSRYIKERCVFCNEEQTRVKRLMTFKGKRICNSCKENILEMVKLL